MSTDAVIVGLLGLFSTAFTFILSKPKQNAEITGTISEASSVAIESLLKVMEELRSGMEDIKEANALLKCEIDKLVEENILLQGEINNLKVQNVSANPNLKVYILRMSSCEKKFTSLDRI